MSLTNPGTKCQFLSSNCFMLFCVRQWIGKYPSIEFCWLGTSCARYHTWPEIILNERKKKWISSVVEEQKEFIDCDQIWNFNEPNIDRPLESAQGVIPFESNSQFNDGTGETEIIFSSFCCVLFFCCFRLAWTIFFALDQKTSDRIPLYIDEKHCIRNINNPEIEF